MNQESFEAKILQLWMTSRVPFTRANLQFATGAPRKKLELWLRQLVVDGVLDADVDDAGEMIYTVRGAERPRTGAETPAELEKLARLSREAQASLGAAATALVLRRDPGGAGGAGGLSLLSAGKGDKSLIASGLLSFLFGPLGWLYAGHWREAIPASAALVLLKLILPSMLLLPILGVVAPVSAGVGVLYAWKFNRTGERQKMLPAEPSKK